HRPQPPETLPCPPRHLGEEHFSPATAQAAPALPAAHQLTGSGSFCPHEATPATPAHPLLNPSAWSHTPPVLRRQKSPPDNCSPRNKPSRDGGSSARSRGSPNGKEYLRSPAQHARRAETQSP